MGVAKNGFRGTPDCLDCSPESPTLQKLFTEVFGHPNKRKGVWRWCVAGREQRPYQSTAAVDLEKAKIRIDNILRKKEWVLL